MSKKEHYYNNRVSHIFSRGILLNLFLFLKFMFYKNNKVIHFIQFIDLKYKFSTSPLYLVLLLVFCVLPDNAISFINYM